MTIPVAADQASSHRRPLATRTAQADTTSADAWTIFWREQRPDSRCCANGPPDLRRALDSHWRGWAATLPPAASVLDIGCGVGAVGRELLSLRPDLRIIGIDLANISPSREPRHVRLPNTPMELLPFADCTFGAAVSQFGYEYGQVRVAAKEVARVLAPGAPLSFLVHHSQSPIVTDNDRSLRALEHLAGDPLRTAFMSGIPTELEQQLALIRRDCPDEGIVEQAALGLRFRIDSNPAERSRVWTAMASALAPEYEMGRSLTASCVAPDEILRWLGPLAEGFELKPPSTLRMGCGRPLSWTIEGRRREIG